MRSLFLLGLIGLSVAVENASTACSTTVVVTQTAVATPAPDSCECNGESHESTLD